VRDTTLVPRECPFIIFVAHQPSTQFRDTGKIFRHRWSSQRASWFPNSQRGARPNFETEMRRKEWLAYKSKRDWAYRNQSQERADSASRGSLAKMKHCMPYMPMHHDARTARPGGWGGGHRGVIEESSGWGHIRSYSN
jgi:hypothetical protein